MKRLIALLSVALFAAPLFAEDTTYNTEREFRNKVFTIQNRDARTIAGAIRLLGSGFKGADLNVNEELRTITVRDFPENIAAIDEAIKRLDKAAAPAPDMTLRISVLIGSKT
ncbi:MAG: secretin N-terminal domain-containing protein, partial [Thermoanaerobaculia bacterium]